MVGRISRATSDEGQALPYPKTKTGLVNLLLHGALLSEGPGVRANRDPNLDPPVLAR